MSDLKFESCKSEFDTKLDFSLYGLAELFHPLSVKYIIVPKKNCNVYLAQKSLSVL